MLQEDKRVQLDGIVQKMVQNKEPEDNIRFVVDDFKKIHSTPDKSALDGFANVSKKSGLQKATEVVGSIFPGQKVGEAIGTLGGLATEKVKGVLGGKDNSEFFDTSAPSPLQVAGDVAAGALNVAGVKGVGTTGTLLKKVATSGALGAGLGASNQIAQTGEIDSDTATSAGVGGAIGGAIPLAGAAISKGLNTLVVKTPKQFVNYALKTPAKQVPKELNEAFLKRKLGGKSLQSIFDTTADEVSTLESQIQDSMTFKRIANSDDLITSIVSKSNEKGSNLTSAKLKDRIQKFVPDFADLLDKPALTDSELNTLRKAIDNNLKEATFLGKELTNEQKTVKYFADKARGVVQKATGTEKLFAQQSEAIGLRKLAEGAMKKAESQGRPGLLDITSAAVGAGLGGVPGAAIGIGIERALRSPQVQGGLAQALRGLKPLQGVIEKMSPVARAGFITTLQSILLGNEKDEQPK